MADEITDAPPERKPPELCEACKAREPGAPACRECSVKALTFHGWIRDGVFYDTRAI